MSHEWKVGEKVAYFSSHSRRPRKIVTVAKVLKLYVEMSDGSKWRLDGWPRGDTSSWIRDHCTPATPEHIDDVKRQILHGRIAKWLAENDASAPVSVLKQIDALLPGTGGPTP